MRSVPASWCRTSGCSASSGWAGARSGPPSTWKADSTTSRSTWRAARRRPVWSPAPIGWRGPPGAAADVIPSLHRLTEPYGGRGAIPRSLQISEWTLENELRQLQTFGFLIPLIFLAVAAFVLNVALTRALALQRQQIAALKALGYSNRQIAWHYIKWGLVIAGLGSAAGIAAGAWLGSGLTRLYNDFFRFPLLDYDLSSG